jgi:hypothetical protein
MYCPLPVHRGGVQCILILAGNPAREVPLPYKGERVLTGVDVKQLPYLRALRYELGKLFQLQVSDLLRAG